MAPVACRQTFLSPGTQFVNQAFVGLSGDGKLQEMPHDKCRITAGVLVLLEMLLLLDQPLCLESTWQLCCLTCSCVHVYAADCLPGKPDPGQSQVVWFAG